MTTHSEHPLTTQHNILYDVCDRCSEHALHPVLSLDNEHLVWLWEKMIKVELDDRGYYASVAERMAAKKLYPFALLLQKFGIDPRYALKGPVLESVIPQGWWALKHTDVYHYFSGRITSALCGTGMISIADWHPNAYPNKECRKCHNEVEAFKVLVS